ncbi:MAG: 1-deoxy-D-xylulose-5-phosphate reductoisomerase [Firmicutes bacterium]|nr:1-deoxy-D-xylulose-5-phosphate reductoisomerase [Bacillota bacterium]MCM1401263.1 1-deoxy-D-xylulose-5-phosphate reductoisomerase [Bacteroides sp.]MCM1477188.1 1-deoxy-D-xylulose-5-phosphate reductoisomerase [Bacteroides sp.]
MEEATLKRIAIIGSTGSIGTQTLETIASYPQLFKAQVLTARSNAALLIEQAIRHRPALVVIADERFYPEVKRELSPLGIEVATGAAAIADAAARDDVDTVVTATVGYSGLAPTMAAIEANKEIALANKETLVVAGEMITRMLAASRSVVVPVDSEHSAIYQCLVGEDRSRVRKLIITASGGPFRNFTARELENVAPSQALKHPNWNMGAKITIDSATMMNKAFEIIEARWLFDISSEKIEAVVHPQSIVHSMVEFTDGAIKAQLGVPDMKLPIRYALAHANRLPIESGHLKLSDYAQLTFEKPDENRFPCLKYAGYALRRMGNSACVVNAANEIAVEAFLKEKIRFTDIPRVIGGTLEKVEFIPQPGYPEYVATNAEARMVAADLVRSLSRRMKS